MRPTRLKIIERNKPGLSVIQGSGNSDKFSLSGPVGAGVNIYEADGKLFISVNAPGMESGDTHVEIYPSRVSISNRSCAKKNQKGQLPRICRVRTQQITLPVEVEPIYANAVFDGGVIRINAPRRDKMGSMGKMGKIGETGELGKADKKVLRISGGFREKKK